MASEFLTNFFNTLPFKNRTFVSLILSKMHQNLDDVIPNNKPIAQYIQNIRELRNIFVRIPLSIRTSLKSILLDGLENCIDSKSVTICIFTTCLCLLDLSAFRNCDRSDLESENILVTILRLKNNILPKLTERVVSQRTNLPSLISWSLCMLIFTSRTCFEWMQHQDYCPSQYNNVNDIIVLTEKVTDHPSIPTLMRLVLRAQSKKISYLEPPSPHSLFDLMFANVVSNNVGLLHASKPAAKYNSDKCILEQSEPKFHFMKLKSLDNVVPIHHLKKHDYLPSSFENSLKNGSLEEIFVNLQLLHQLLLDQPNPSEMLFNSLLLTLKQTPFILAHIKQHECHQNYVFYYEKIYCMLLQFWFRVTERRLLLTCFPQSYVWLIGFVQPNYKIMSMDGFVQNILWTGRFLTIYLTLFRSSIMASPHWYLQMIIDGILAVIDRSENEQQEQMDDDQFEDALCTCVLAISKPFNALKVEESNVYEELSRVIKLPLENILSRMVTCRKIVSQLNAKSSNNKWIDKPPISQRLRDLILNHLVYPMIRASDTWALEQARIGLKPTAAKVMLKQLLNNFEVIEPNREAIHVASKLDNIKPQPAVGGLHSTQKLSMKRKL